MLAHSKYYIHIFRYYHYYYLQDFFLWISHIYILMWYDNTVSPHLCFVTYECLLGILPCQHVKCALILCNATWGCIIRMYQNAFSWFFNEGLSVIFILSSLKQWGSLVQAALDSWASTSLCFVITGSTNMHGFNLINWQIAFKEGSVGLYPHQKNRDLFSLTH